MKRQVKFINAILTLKFVNNPLTLKLWKLLKSC